MLGATPVPNSGALPGGGGDFRMSVEKSDKDSRTFLIEHKHTDKASYILKREVLRDIEAKAIGEARRPMLIVNFSGEMYCIMRIEDSGIL